MVWEMFNRTTFHNFVAANLNALSPIELNDFRGGTPIKVLHYLFGGNNLAVP